MDTNKIKVAYICTHNSCRSQIAEALSKHLANDVFESYSAGTDIKDKINEDALRLVKKIYSIDMEETQKPKLIKDIPEVDIVVTMGCSVVCPFMKAKHREDFGLDDPTGKGDNVFIKTIETIHKKIIELKEKTKTMDFKK